MIVRVVTSLALVGLLVPTTGATVDERNASEIEAISLELSTILGRGLFKHCRLEVGLNNAPGESKAELTCVFNNAESTLLHESSPLDQDQAERLRSLVGAAGLFETEKAGRDLRCRDGVLETLTLSTPSRAVALVTSGNPAFLENGPRRELTRELADLKRQLYETWTERARTEQD
jgi:hypothetical protein